MPATLPSLKHVMFGQVELQCDPDMSFDRKAVREMHCRGYDCVRYITIPMPEGADIIHRILHIPWPQGREVTLWRGGRYLRVAARLLYRVNRERLRTATETYVFPDGTPLPF